MLIVVDKRLSEEAKEKLSGYGELMELETIGITYPAISGHPDIFFCQGPGKLIIAPNLPKPYFDLLDDHRIEYVTGEFPVGKEYPSSARYNAVATDKYLIHNFRHTDFMITRELEDLTPIHVDQGYCRCNLLPLKDGNFITSDAGILKVLKGLQPKGTPAQRDSSPEGLQPLGLHPSGILLDGFPHGFFGGCCGIWENIVFVNGNLTFYNDGGKVRDFLENLDYEIIELNPGQLKDCGSIFCFQD